MGDLESGITRAELAGTRDGEAKLAWTQGTAGERIDDIIANQDEALGDKQAVTHGKGWPGGTVGLTQGAHLVKYRLRKPATRHG
jgi:hypothetical protein